MPTVYGKITQENIDRGVTEQDTKCPLARSIRGHLNCLASVRVNSENVLVDSRFGSVNIPLPPALRTWILRFDSGKPVELITWSITGFKVGKYFRLNK